MRALAVRDLQSDDAEAEVEAELPWERRARSFICTAAGVSGRAAGRDSFGIEPTPWALNINQFPADICVTSTSLAAKRECNSRHSHGLQLFRPKKHR